MMNKKHSGNEPALPEGKTDAPMLGGERALPRPCPYCNTLMVRDFFGEYICFACVERTVEMQAILELDHCPECGRYLLFETSPVPIEEEYLWTHDMITDDWISYPFDKGGREEILECGWGCGYQIKRYVKRGSQ